MGALRLLLRCLILFLAVPTFYSIAATNEGNQVVIVYNSRMPGSKEVAEHYAEKRMVPASHIFGFSLTTNEDISRGDFRDELQKPLSKALEKANLWHIGLGHVPFGTNRALHTIFMVDRSEIRYAVLCYGVPLRIAEDPTIKEDRPQNLRPDQRFIAANTAAVDNELAILPLMDNKINLGGPLPNHAYGATNAGMLHPTNGLLLVTRLDGPCADVAKGLVDKALQAEKDGLWGRAYFDLRNTSDPGYKIGDDWIRRAAEVAKHEGFETIVDENSAVFPAGFPMSQIAIYMGWYAGNVEGPLRAPKVEFMPGAIAYHLHSNSGASLRLTNQFWAGPMLARGATVTMGCVSEPYLGYTPDIGTFAVALMFRRFTFGEAAYAGLNSVSWQTTVIGDPLYRPFGKSPEELGKQLETEHSKLLEWSFLQLANLGLNNGKPAGEVAALLENIPLAKQSAVLQEKLGDLYAAAGKPASALHADEQALKLGSSPMQKLRLLLTLADKHIAANEDAKAYACLHRISQDYPEYADKDAIEQKMLPLARKLGKTADVERLEAERKKAGNGQK
jgi:uncharacterized protein (TIGR03790 family)